MFKGPLTHQYHIKLRSQSEYRIQAIGFIMKDTLRNYENNQNDRLLYFILYLTRINNVAHYNLKRKLKKLQAEKFY